MKYLCNIVIGSILIITGSWWVILHKLPSSGITSAVTAASTIGAVREPLSSPKAYDHHILDDNMIGHRPRLAHLPFAPEDIAAIAVEAVIAIENDISAPAPMGAGDAAKKTITPSEWRGDIDWESHSGPHPLLQRARTL